MVETTKKQGKVARKKIYDFIKSYIQKNKYAPTVREISEGVGLKSTSTIHMHLSKLKYMGVLTYEEKKPRTIRILRELIEK